MPGGPAELQHVAPSRVFGANVLNLGFQGEAVGRKHSPAERVAACRGQKLEVTRETIQPHCQSAAGLLQMGQVSWKDLV